MSERLRMQPFEINGAKLVLIMEVSKHNTVSFLVASTNLEVKLLPTCVTIGNAPGNGTSRWLTWKPVKH